MVRDGGVDIPLTPHDARRRLDDIGDALYRTASDAIDGRRREVDALYGQLLYSALMRIREHAGRENVPAYDRVRDIKLICEAALGTDGPPAPRGPP